MCRPVEPISISSKQLILYYLKYTYTSHKKGFRENTLNLNRWCNAKCSYNDLNMQTLMNRKITYILVICYEIYNKYYKFVGPGTKIMILQQFRKSIHITTFHI